MQLVGSLWIFTAWRSNSRQLRELGRSERISRSTCEPNPVADVLVPRISKDPHEDPSGSIVADGILIFRDAAEPAVDEELELRFDGRNEGGRMLVCVTRHHVFLNREASTRWRGRRST